MEPRVITDKIDYEGMLAEIDRLMALDPKEGSPEAVRLNLFATLVEKYEIENFPINPPNPIDAILFRMEERGLKQSDLTPLIGSKSKVSEILSGKRNLTLAMIRSLSKELSIPVDILVREPFNSDENAQEDIEQYPKSIMKKLGWISGNSETELIRSMSDFLKRVAGVFPSPVMLRKTVSGKGAESFNQYAIYAWVARILNRAEEEKNVPDYDPKLITESFLRSLVTLSLSSDGPRLARERLLKYGIILLFEQHLPKTKLDGASFLTKEGNPVVGMTLRFDRIDNFWFTLMHELVHIQLHIKKSDTFFFDDINSEASDDKEREADEMAAEYLISRKLWTRSPVKRQPSEKLIYEYSKIWNVHPAIIAGQVQHEKENYTNFSKLLGQGEVRKQFNFVPVK